jgi:hypothetical protein
MQIDHSKLQRRITARFVALQVLYSAVVIVLLVAFRLSDQPGWPAEIDFEVSYVLLSTSVIALIALIVFPLRSWFDPDGVIYGSPDGQTAASRRSALRNHGLMYLFLGLVVAYLASLFVPECASRRACIDFSEVSALIFVSKSVLPLVMVLVLGQSIGSGVGFVMAWLRG